MRRNREQGLKYDWVQLESENQFDRNGLVTICYILHLKVSFSIKFRNVHHSFLFHIIVKILRFSFILSHVQFNKEDSRAYG